MTQAGAHILVKLLSGPNAGAEMELSPGDWILGSDEASHILVLDAGVRAQHLLLHVEDSGELTLLPRGGSAFAGGEALPPDGMAVPPFTVFTVGGTHMAHGPADEPWPELTLPSLVASVPVAGAGDESPAAREQAGKATISGPAEKVGNNAPGALPTANRVGASPVKRVVLLAILALLLFGLIIDYTQLGFFFSDMNRDAASFARSLHRRGFAHVTVTPRENGAFFVHGTVPSNATMDALVAYVERSGKKAELSITSLEDLVAALQAQAKRMDAPLRITRSGNMLRVSGYVYDMLALEEVLIEEREALATVPARVDVTTWEQAGKEIRSMIAARNLDAKVRAIPGIYRVILQSQPLSASEQQAMRGLIRESEDIFGVEGVLLVERWKPVPQAVPRPASPARVLTLTATEATAPPRPIQESVPKTAEPAAPKAPAPAQSAPSGPALPGPDENMAAVKQALPEILQLPQPPDFPGIVAQQDFSCSQLRIVGEGYNMAVIYGGVRYKTGAKMPDSMQVKHIAPGYVVLQRGKIHTRICTAGETAKETLP